MKKNINLIIPSTRFMNTIFNLSGMTTARASEINILIDQLFINDSSLSATQE